MKASIPLSMDIGYPRVVQFTTTDGDLYQAVQKNYDEYWQITWPEGECTYWGGKDAARREVRRILASHDRQIKPKAKDTA